MQSYELMMIINAALNADSRITDVVIVHTEPQVADYDILVTAATGQEFTVQIWEE